MAVTIGVLSDTHLRAPDSSLISLLEGPLGKVDLIVHLGDFVEVEVLKLLRKRPFVGVKGNRDGESLRGLLPERELLEIEGFRIGLIHGKGPFWGMPFRIRGFFKEVDAVLFGHTHRPFLRVVDRIMYMNPGAFRRDPLGGFKRRYGILRIQGGISGKLCSA